MSTPPKKLPLSDADMAALWRKHKTAMESEAEDSSDSPHNKGQASAAKAPSAKPKAFNPKKAKLIRVQFQRLTQQQEQQVRSFINKIALESAGTGPQPRGRFSESHNSRNDFRLPFKGILLPVVVHVPQKNGEPPLEEATEAYLVDLSVGGCCLAFPEHFKLIKASTIAINLSLLPSPFQVNGTILGLRPQQIAG